MGAGDSGRRASKGATGVSIQPSSDLGTIKRMGAGTRLGSLRPATPLTLGAGDYPPAAETDSPTLRRAAELTAFFALPAVVDLLVVLAILGGANLSDFTIFRNAGAAVLHGHSPWDVFGFVYPASAAVFYAPFALIPYPLAAAMFCVLDVLAIVASLWIVGVRDWRCYSVALASVPFAKALMLGTISPLMALAIAAAWRYRDRAAVSGGAVAAAIALKIFLWPILIWFLATRRVRATAVGICLSIFTTACSWLVIGPSTVTQFIHSLSSDTGWATYSVLALLRSLHVPRTAAYFVIALSAAVLLTAMWRAATKPEGEWSGFVLSLGAALVLTPVMHVHTLVILIPVIAVVRPRLAPLWAVPIAYLFVWRSAGAYGSAREILAVLVIATVCLTFAARSTLGRPRRRSAESVAAL